MGKQSIPREPIGVYVKVNADEAIIEVNSSIYIKYTTDWYKIDEGYGSKYWYAQSQYFDKPVIDENGIPNYAFVNGKVVERDKTADLRQLEIKSYPSVVENMIRQKYSVSAELAILRQRDTKPAEFAEYDSYCEECKQKARSLLKLTTEVVGDDD